MTVDDNGSDDEESSSRFVGDPIPDEKARRRWPQRYQERIWYLVREWKLSLETFGMCESFIGRHIHLTEACRLECYASRWSCFFRKQAQKTAPHTRPPAQNDAH